MIIIPIPPAIRQSSFFYPLGRDGDALFIQPSSDLPFCHPRSVKEV